jgi:hypothetical protein
MRSRLRVSLFLVIAALFPFAAFAAVDAQLVTSANTLEWQSASNHVTVLSLQRPDGDVVTETFAAGHNPMLRLQGLADGVYSYELRAANGVQSGSFTVANGMIVAPDAIESAITARPLRPATNEFFTDDVSAQGGVCAGFDCTATESYGFASAKLKENNTRLKFEDTSAAPFPTTDWQLSANDTTSGGANKFFVEDLTAVSVPFLIEGGTPTNTLYVDSNGRVGIRTSTPSRELSIDAPVSPGIRMGQSASPFQAWDIVASNVSFNVRDVNHETMPFVIKPSAPTNSLLVDSAGNIGLGVAVPTFQIHHSSGARLDAGVWTNASSRDVKQDIATLDSDAAFDALRSLQPVTYAYKTNPGDQHVGFIAEDVPAIVATSDRKGLSSMDITAVLTKIVQEQQKTIEDLQARLECLEQKE